MKEYKLKINGNDYDVAVNSLTDDRADVTVNGKNYTVNIASPAAAPAARPAAAPQPSAPAAAPAPAAAKPAVGGAIKSPLPGVVLDVKVAVGDRVSVGQRLMILEAMKMENNIDSDKQGTVKEIKVHTGDSVLEGDVLMTIE